MGRVTPLDCGQQVQQTPPQQRQNPRMRLIHATSVQGRRILASPEVPPDYEIRDSIYAVRMTDPPERLPISIRPPVIYPPF